MKKNTVKYIIYFLLVFCSNLFIVLMTRFIETNKLIAFIGNAGYEACNVCSLYIGIKNLPLKDMLIWHLFSASAGYIVAQYIGNFI